MTGTRRSTAWYGKPDRDAFIQRSWMKNQGYPDHAFDGRPITGNCNTWSERTRCNAGLRDMIRVSGARMSGTAFGTVILHASPEAQAGGPLALAKTGDRIGVSASAGALDVLGDASDMAARRGVRTPEPPHCPRGYAKLYVDHVLQADRDADPDFLDGKDTRTVTRESHR